MQLIEQRKLIAKEGIAEEIYPFSAAAKFSFT